MTLSCIASATGSQQYKKNKTVILETSELGGFGSLVHMLTSLFESVFI